MKKSVLYTFRRSIRLLFCGVLSLAWATEAGAQCLNHALDFDGVDDAVTCTLNSPLGNSDFTFEAWVTSTATGTTANCTGPNSFRRLFQLANSGLSPNRIDLGECNGYITMAWQDFFGFHGPYMTTGFIRDNNWHNLAMVKTPGQIKVFLDCDLIFTATDYATVGNFFITNVTLGATPFNGPNYWKGKVDEVRLWSDAHTDTQVCDERFCPVPRKGMTLYWPMDEGVPLANNSSVTQVGVGLNKGTLSNLLLLPGPTSNFDCSTAPVNYPNYYPLHVEIKDPLNQNLITQMCNGEAAHFCLLNSDGSSPAPATNTSISWQQSDDNGSGYGPYTPVPSAAFSSNNFCFIVPKDNITFDCATSTRGYVDRRYIAFITVTQNGHVCDFFTANAVVRICCPVTEASVQMTVSPSSLLNGTLCEGDQLTVDVSLTSATHPFINPPGDALSITWAPPFNSHNGQTSFTETLTVGADDLCATATLTNCACAPLTVGACVPVDPVPKCGPMTGLLVPNNLLPDPDGDPGHYLICPGDDAALGAVFDDCVPHWQYSFDQVSWTELGVSNTEQNTNILPTSAWGSATCIYYRVECRPMSDPSGCDPCYCGIVRICLKPPPLKPVITGDDLICKSDVSSLLSVQTPEPGVTYTWYCNGKELSTGLSINADMNACYRVKADNGCETALSDPFCLKICEVFAVISCPLTPNDCVEPGVPIELTGALSYSTCGGPLVYAWSSNNTTLAGPVDQPDLTDTPQMNGTVYTLTVTDQNGCSDTKSTLVKPCKL